MEQSKPPSVGNSIHTASPSSDRVSIHARLAMGDSFPTTPIPNTTVSIHARLATGDTPHRRRHRPRRRFNSRPSCDGRRSGVRSTFTPNERFKSRPSCDGRPNSPARNTPRSGFNSRPSCDGRPALPRSLTNPLKFQFTPVLRRATLRAGMT